MFTIICRNSLLYISFLLLSFTYIQPGFADGELDTTFGNGGMVAFTDPRISEYKVEKVFFQGDKILIAGSVFDHYEAPIPRVQSFFFARFLADGSLDESFGNNPELDAYQTWLNPEHEVFGNGFTIVNRLGDFSIAGITISDQGNILTVLNGPEQIKIVKVSSDGEVAMREDGTPDGPEYVFFWSSDYPQFPEGAIVYDVETQTDGKILLVGDVPNSTGGFIARLNNDGSPDLGFSEDGIQELVMGRRNSISGLTPLSDGGVAVGGTFFHLDANRNSGYLAKFTGEGEPDLTFGDSGIQTLIDVAGNTFRAISCAQDGGIFTVWDYFGAFYYFADSIVKSDSSGQLDLGFSDDGVVRIASSTSSGIRGFGVLNGGSMITLIKNYRTPNFTRFDKNGTLDPNFITTALGSESMQTLRMSIRSDGNIFILTEKPKDELDAKIQLFSIKNSIPPLKSDFSQCGESAPSDDVFKDGFEGLQ